MSGRRLSVALPVRNGDNFLAAALDSILSQSFADFDLVVSDNASTDRTPEILADYARRDARVQPSRSDTMISQMANMNRAVALAPGQWVKLFCHDDLMREDCLAVIDALLDDVDASNVALIGNDERHLYANGYLSDGPADAPPMRLSGRTVIENSLGGREPSVPAITTATVRKSAFLEFGGFDDRYVHFDIFGWLELMATRDYAHLPMALTVNRIHGRQVAASARASLRSVHDYRGFIGDYLDRRADQLHLPPNIRRRARFKPLGVAAMTIALELMCHRWSVAAAMVRKLPSTWLPLLAPLVIRAWRKERRRLQALQRHVPPAMIYP